MGKRQAFLEHRIILFATTVTLLLASAIILPFISGSNPLVLRVGTLILLGVTITIFIMGYFTILLPYRRSKHILRLFASGYTLSTIVDESVPLNKELQAASQMLIDLVNTDQLMNESKRQAQYLALQNQINPHFLYNTLEGIRGEALLGGLNSVATMTEALSTFFRYTISGVENLVTLNQELENTQNYFFIQQFRFGARIKLEIYFEEEDPEELLSYRIPKLTLQPIVENSIVHGLECKVGEGTLLIRIEHTKTRLLVTIRDDGVGMPKEVLDRIQHRITTRSFEYVKRDEQEGGIALVNVNNRIKLLFGEQYGLNVTSEVGVGTDVVISLPQSKEERSNEG